MKQHEFIDSVQESLQIPSSEMTEDAVRVVLSLLSHRLMPDEFSDVNDQLSHPLKALWQSNTWFSNFAKLSHRKYLEYRKPEQLYARIQNELEKRQIAMDVEAFTRTVFHLLKAEISEGEANDIAAQLPRDIERLWNAA